MIDIHSVLESALAIRSHLTDLLGSESGEQMQRQLDQLLQQFQDGDDVEDDIWELLTEARTTRTWVTQYQTQYQPITYTQKGLEPLPGHASNIQAPQFKCPRCDYHWSRDRVGRPTPLCPIHGIPLQKA
ncbi:MAG: hypothetical protein QNJ46_30680 [Leptolyngbyaceae cyanobacterium MO_188.B28]|nr:hypothetical protein [Leptolyngbyaceae cyanobacterium MO_188.B28]